MDINRVPNEKKLKLCRWYFRGNFLSLQETLKFEKYQNLSILAGFAFLPFVWVVNAVWFFETAFKKDPFDEQKAIRNCKCKYRSRFVDDSLPLSPLSDVIYSAIGSLIWFLVIATWVAMFQANRIAWGEWADDLSFIIPLGSK